MTEPSQSLKRGPCQCCGETADLKCGPSRFGAETWACDGCWNPDHPSIDAASPLTETAIQSILEDEVYCDRFEGTYEYGDAVKRIMALSPSFDRTTEAFCEIANRASNFMDPDAAEWMPSIYKIACEAAGEDPWPLLEAAGWKRDELTVSVTRPDGNEAKAVADFIRSYRIAKARGEELSRPQHQPQPVNCEYPKCTFPECPCDVPPVSSHNEKTP